MFQLTTAEFQAQVQAKYPSTQFKFFTDSTGIQDSILTQAAYSENMSVSCTEWPLEGATHFEWSIATSSSGRMLTGLGESLEEAIAHLE